MWLLLTPLPLLPSERAVSYFRAFMSEGGKPRRTNWPVSVRQEHFSPPAADVIHRCVYYKSLSIVLYVSGGGDSTPPLVLQRYSLCNANFTWGPYSSLTLKEQHCYLLASVIFSVSVFIIYSPHAKTPVFFNPLPRPLPLISTLSLPTQKPPVCSNMFLRRLALRSSDSCASSTSSGTKSSSRFHLSTPAIPCQPANPSHIMDNTFNWMQTFLFNVILMRGASGGDCLFACKWSKTLKKSIVHSWFMNVPQLNED